MAWMPCISCRQRFSGEALNAYFSVPYGDQREAYRFVGCEPCLEELLKWWRTSALYRDQDGDWVLPELDDSPSAKLSPSEPPQGPSRGKGGPRGRPGQIRG